MYIELTITAVANRDESCNMLTFNETHRFSIAMPPTPDKVRQLLEDHKAKFLEMWPHKGVAKPSLIPLDVTVIERDGSE
jgi:hypothetical protein